MAAELEILGWGLASGLLGGLFGIGGGIILVNIFPYYLSKMGVGENSIVALTIANSLFVTFFSTLSANFRNWKKGNFPLEPILRISASSIGISLPILYFWVQTPHFNRTIFDFIFLSILAFTGFRFFYHRNADIISDLEKPLQGVTNFKWNLAGLVSGVISPLTGMGGGIVLVPILHDRFKLPMLQSQAISLGAISLTTLSIAVFNALTQPALTTVLPGNVGFLFFPVALPAAIGGMIGAQAGILLSSRLSQRVSRILFSLLLLTLVFVRIFPLWK